MTGGPLLKVGALFEGYRITKVVASDGGSPGGAIQCFKAIRAADLRIDAVRMIYCMRPESDADAADTLADFSSGVDRLKALTLPELPEVEDGGYSDGILWVAVQDVRGETLKDLILKRDITEPWPLEACLRLVADLARVFKAASEKGVAHYHFLPQDVFCSPDLKLRKLTGMGIYQLFGKTVRTPQHTCDLLNMAPEQLLKDGVVSLKTDVYLVGLVFYELCTLDMPFADAKGMAPTGDWLLKLITTATLEPLSTKRGFPEFIDRFFRRLVACAPERRLGWQSVIDEAEATAVFVERRMLPPSMPMTHDEDEAPDDKGGEEPARVQEPTSPEMGRKPPEEPPLLPPLGRTRRRPSLRAASGAALFVLGCGVLFFLSSRPGHTLLARRALSSIEWTNSLQFSGSPPLLIGEPPSGPATEVPATAAAPLSSPAAMNGSVSTANGGARQPAYSKAEPPSSGPLGRQVAGVDSAAIEAARRSEATRGYRFWVVPGPLEGGL